MAGYSPDVVYFVDKGTVPQYGSLRKIKKMPVKSSGPSSAEVVSILIQILFVFQYGSH